MSKDRKSKNQRLPALKKTFAKKKDKVGKKKAKPENETRTTFKARAIIVPRQRALETAVLAEATKESTQTTATTSSRKLSLSELLPRLGHSSEQTRLEALSGVRDLATRQPDTLRLSAGLVLERLAQLVPDADRTVRAHLRMTLCKVIGALGLAASSPFMPLVVAYICSGMTHLQEPVRADSVELAAALLAQYPPLSRRFARRILANFGTIIASPRTMQQSYQRQHPAAVGSDMERHLRQQVQAASLPVSSFKTRAAALQSLLRFLRDLSSDDQDSSVSSTRTIVWSEAYPVVIGLTHSLPLPGPISTSTTTTTTTSANEGKLGLADAVGLLESLHPGLCELWMEASPVAMDNADVLRNALETLGILIDKALSASTADFTASGFQRYFDDYVRLIMPHFPFTVEPETKMADAARLQRATLATELNSLVCKLFATFLSKQPPCNGDGCTCWASSLISFVQNTLAGFASSRIPSQLAIAVASLLPNLRIFLAHVPATTQTALLDSFSRFSEACASASTARQLCIAFITSMTITIDEPLRTEKELKPWIGSLPKLLWQLKLDNLQTTDMALTVLLHCARLSAAGGVDFLQDSLVPFFHVTVTNKKTAQKSELFGPFLGLSAELQEKALHALYFFSSLSPAMERALLACMLEVRATKTTASAVQELLAYQHHWKSPDRPLTDFAASASALLVGATAALAGTAEARVSTPSAVIAVEQLCESARRVGATEEVLSCCGLVLPAAFAGRGLPANSQSAWPLLSFILACSSQQQQILCPSLTSLCVSCIAAAIQHRPQTGDAIPQKDVVATAEAVVAKYPDLLAILLSSIAERLSVDDPVSRSKWCSSLVCVLELPLLRTPRLLLAENTRTTVIAISKAQLSEELRQAVSLLYALP